MKGCIPKNDGALEDAMLADSVLLIMEEKLSPEDPAVRDILQKAIRYVKGARSARLGRL